MTFVATKTTLTRTDSDILISGSYNMNFMAFSFDDSWDGMVKTAVIKTRFGTYHIMLSDDCCGIPQAALAEAGNIKVGVYGIKDQIIQPTVWVENIKVWSGAYDPLLLPNYPDSSLYEQIMSALSDCMERSVYDQGGRFQDVFDYVDESVGSQDVKAYDTIYEFPNQGSENVLYIVRSDNTGWRWDPDSLTYKCIGRDYSEVTTINGGNA